MIRETRMCARLRAHVCARAHACERVHVRACVFLCVCECACVRNTDVHICIVLCTHCGTHTHTCYGVALVNRIHKIINLSFAKEPYKRDKILQKRPIIYRSYWQSPHIWQFPLKKLHYRNPPNRETRMFRYLAIQIQIEIQWWHWNLYRGIWVSGSGWYRGSVRLCVCACVCVCLCACGCTARSQKIQSLL